MINSIKKNTLLLFILLSCMLVSTDVNALWLSSRSDMYNWIERGNDPSTINDLIIQDGWSSRNVYFIPGEHYLNEDIEFIAESFKNLKSIVFNLNVEITDGSFQSLQELPKLEDIWLRETVKITDNGLSKIANAVPQLQSLGLEGPLPNVTGSSLSKVFASLPYLKCLSIDRGYPHANFLISWNMLSQALRNTTIEKLTFSSGYDAGTTAKAVEAWTGAFSTMPNLGELEINRLGTLQAHTILEGVERSGAAVERLKLRGTSLKLGHALAFPSQLKTLFLDQYVFNGEPEALAEVMVLASNSASLERLEIRSLFPPNYELIDLEEKVLNGFSSLRVLKLNQKGYTSPSLIELGKRIKLSRPDLQVFVGDEEIQ